MAKKKKTVEKVQSEKEKTHVFLYRGKSFGTIYDGFLFRGTEKQLKAHFCAELEKEPSLIRNFEKLT